MDYAFSPPEGVYMISCGFCEGEGFDETGETCVACMGAGMEVTPGTQHWRGIRRMYGITVDDCGEA